MKPAAYDICVIALLFTLIISFYNLFMHCRYYSRPELQSHAVRIVMLIPLFSLGTWLSVVNHENAFIYESILDFWEALVVYSFFMLILTYAGGEHVWYQSSQHTHPDGLDHPWPLKYVFPPMALDPMFMRNCKRACLQFVLIKPFMVLVHLFVMAAGYEESSLWTIFNAIVYNITYSVALYALGLLYLTMHHHPGLMGKRPVAKFLSVKLVVFFTFWQQALIKLIPRAEENNYKEIAIMIEMLIFSIPINFLAFYWKEFRIPNLKGGFIASTKLAFRNLMRALSPWDLADSATMNFRQRYEAHVLLEEPDDQPPVVSEVPVIGRAVELPIIKQS
jgi:hypothetical protein